MSFEFILPLRPIEPSVRRTTKQIATRLAPRKGLKCRPFLGLHPASRCPRSLFSNRNSVPTCAVALGTRRLRVCGWLGCTRPFHREGPAQFSSLSQPNSGPISPVYPLPPNTLTSSYYLRYSNRHEEQNKFAGSQVQWNGCFAFVLLRMMQTGEEPVKVSLRLASLDL